ncbi:M23 family metallopeptidase [Allosphingosinicella vermicomposti]|uniref:M23 family metallopeptidase n=1 Tax=Allosphingosinicella vermicomposti TaxID=614671 RepID=UPI000D0E9737|nr:M23 family metallopeptidase [Allosphingosinicella vermicomposti]
MTNIAKTTKLAGRFPVVFKQREFFYHDGKALKRFSVSGEAQAAGAVLLLMLLIWSAFAAAKIATAAPENDVERMARQVQAMQADVKALKAHAAARYGKTAAEVEKLGLDPERFTGVGGPFEVVEPLKTADPNFKSLFTSWKQLDQLEQGMIAIPSAMPVKGTALTSKFGVRSDPFQGRAAMHAGVDLAGPLGTPIYATADGYVQRSNWVGGYGNLVELNHGRGIQTRYGHLSKALVAPGQRVKRGDLIALMGSTGRSTGSHLHYEVRIDGKAVNPVPFLQSNEYLAAVQRRASSQLAYGGPKR